MESLLKDRRRRRRPPIDGEPRLIVALIQANPRLADRKDEDDRLPLHWAVSSNYLAVVELLVQTTRFDPDSQVTEPNGRKHPAADCCLLTLARMARDGRH